MKKKGERLPSPVMKFGIALFLLLLHLFAPIACDEPEAHSFAHAQAEAMQEERDYSFRDQILNTLFALAMVIGLLVLAGWLMRRLSRSRMRYGNHAHHIKVVERRPIAPKTTLYLLDIAGQGVVIADSPGGVRTLYELPAGTDLSALAGKEEMRSTKPKFVDILQRRMDKKC